MATVSEITSDPALESQLFWEQYKTTIIAVAAVLVLGGLAFAGYQIYTMKAASDAVALLTAADSPEEFQKVIERYPGSEPAASASLLLAGQQRTKKNYAEANTTLRKFIDQYPKHQLITTAWMGIGANLASLGKTDEALSTYQRLAKDYPQSFNAPLALLAQVPLLKAKNQIDEARRACETIMSQHRDSIVANQAIQELMALPQPAAAAAPQPGPSAAPIPMARPPEAAAPIATP